MIIFTYSSSNIKIRITFNKAGRVAFINSTLYKNE